MTGWAGMHATKIPRWMDWGNGHYHKVMESAPSMFFYPQILSNPTDNWKQEKDLHIAQLTAMRKSHKKSQMNVRLPVADSFNSAGLITWQNYNFLGNSAWHVIKCTINTAAYGSVGSQVQDVLSM